MEIDKTHKIDNETFDNIQKLLSIFDLVKETFSLSVEELQDIDQIKNQIKIINKPERLKSWNFIMNLKDYSKDSKNQGIYQRIWNISFENDIFDLTTESYHTDNVAEPMENEYFYYYIINFQKEFDGKNIFTTDKIESFVEDFKNYKKYMTNTMNNISFYIEIW